MTSLPPSAIVRRPAIAGLAAGSAIALCSLVVVPKALADPAACPGLLEGLAALLALAAPGTPASLIVVTLNTLALGAAVACFVWLSLRLGFALVPALLAATAMAVALAGGPGYALSAAGSIAAGCLALGHTVAIAGTPAAATRSAWFGSACGLAATAAMSPPLAIPLSGAALLVTILARRRHRPSGLLVGASIATALVVAATGAITAIAVPPLPGTPMPTCVAPLPSDMSFAALQLTVSAAGARISPAVFVLAILGLAATATRWRTAATVQGALLVVASLITTTWLDPEPTRTLAIPVAGLWVLCAGGLQAVWANSRVRSIRPGVVAIGVVLALLTLARVVPGSSAAHDLGHVRVTRNDVAAIRIALPAGAVVVRDDVLTDVLWRSLPNTKRARFIPADRSQVMDALSAGPVFALPRAARTLSRLGTDLAQAGRVAPAGLSRVISSAPCLALGPDAAPLELPSGAVGLTLVADEPGAMGPALVHLAGPGAIAFTRSGWPRSAERGFFTSGLLLEDDAAMRQFDIDRAANGIPDGWPAVGTFVARLEVWRVPGAPRALTVEIAGPITAALASSLADGDEALAVCPAFDVAVEPLGPRTR